MAKKWPNGKTILFLSNTFKKGQMASLLFLALRCHASNTSHSEFWNGAGGSAKLSFDLLLSLSLINYDRHLQENAHI